MLVIPASLLSIQGSRRAYPVFGLPELGNEFAHHPNNPDLLSAVGEEVEVVFQQHYTPIVKGLEERVRLAGRPHLLTYILDKEYVSRRPKFARVWSEVETDRCRSELIELANENVRIEARFEVVLTGDDSSFISHFMHRTLARLFVINRFLVKVSAAQNVLFPRKIRSYCYNICMALYPMQIPIPQFSGYVRSLVNELYEPLQAAIDGNLTGTAGTLGTVLLCETLLSYLPTCNPMNQPYRILSAYDVEPRSALKRTNQIDLSRYTSTACNREGVCATDLHHRSRKVDRDASVGFLESAKRTTIITRFQWGCRDHRQHVSE